MKTINHSNLYNKKLYAYMSIESFCSPRAFFSLLQPAPSIIMFTTTFFALSLWFREPAVGMADNWSKAGSEFICYLIVFEGA